MGLFSFPKKKKQNVLFEKFMALNSYMSKYPNKKSFEFMYYFQILEKRCLVDKNDQFNYIIEDSSVKKYAGYFLLWKSIICLTCAEKTRIGRISTQSYMGSARIYPKKETWISCAEKAIEFLKGAEKYLPMLSTYALYSDIITRAEKQKQISFSLAKDDPLYTEINETIRGGSMIQPGVIAVDWIFTISKCTLTIKDYIKTAESLPGHQILTKWDEGTDSF